MPEQFEVAGGREIESLCTGLFYDRMIGLIIAMLKSVEIICVVHNHSFFNSTVEYWHE